MAGANAIATGTTILTADADKLTAGLGKASKQVEGWGKNTAATFKLTMGQLSSIVGGAAFGGAIGASIVSSVSSAAHRIPSLVMDSLGDMAKQNAFGKALGLSAEQFTGMAGVAKSVGEDTREFVESLVTMGKLGHDAAAGIGDVAGPAFAQLNIDAKEFVGLRADQQFFQMFDALSKVGDGLTRTRLIMNAFGEDGGKWLLPLLSKSPDQLRKMADGFALNERQMRLATVASEAYKGAQFAAMNAVREMAITAAPTVVKLSEAFSKGFTDARPAIELATTLVGGFVEQLAPAIGKLGELADGWQRTAKASEGLGDTWIGSYARWQMKGGFGGMMVRSDYAPSASEVFPAMEVMLTHQTDSWKKLGSEIHRTGQTFFSWFGGPKPGARGDTFADTNAFLNNLNKPVQAPPTVYGSAFGSAIRQASNLQKASKSSWEWLLVYNQWLDKNSDVKFSDTKQGQTPQMKKIYGFAGMLGGWGGMLGDAWGGLGKDVTSGGRWRGVGDKIGSHMFAGAAEQGSHDAYKLEQAAKYGIGRDDTKGIYDKLPLYRQQLDEQKKANQKLDKLNTNIEKLGEAWTIK